MRTCFYLILQLLAVPAQPGDRMPSDKEALQGKWSPISAATGNPDKDRQIPGQWVFEFDGDTLRMSHKKLGKEAYVFKIDPRKKPKEIDLHMQGGQNPEVPMLGIYAIEGDRLKLSWSKIDGKFRPTSFDLAPGKNVTRQVSLVLERVKK